MSIGVVLSGGAAIGFAHIGFWKALKEKNIKINYIIGSSMGSIIAAAIAIGLDLEYVENFAKNIKKSKILDPTWLMLIKNIWKLTTGKPIIGLYDLKRVEKILRKEFGNAKIEDCKIPLEIASVNINTGEKIYFNKGYIVDAILDSICIPIIFEPRSKNLDGLLRVNFPIERASNNCEKIIGMHFGFFKQCDIDIAKTNLFYIATQSMQIISNEQSFSDIQYIKAIGKDITVINPKINNINPFDFHRADELIKIGYNESIRLL